MPVRRASCRLSLSLLLVVLLTSPAVAITDEEYFRNFRFNFGNPGARALAMGGAFIAIANDATAAQANPARIAAVRRPEFFAEVRSRDTDPFRAPGKTISFSPNPSTEISQSAEVTPETQTTLSDVAFVWPFTIGKKHLSVSVSRQELLAVTSDSENDARLIPENASLFQVPGQEEVVLTSGQGRVDTSLALWSLAAGFEVTPHLFLGGSLVVGQGKLEGEQISTFADQYQLTTLGGLDPKFQDPNSINDVFLRTEIPDESDTDLKWSFGVFWTMNDYLSFGATYKKGVELEFAERIEDLTGGSTLGLPDEVTTTFKIPDVSGLGVSYRPFAGSLGKKRANLLFALDVNRVENEDLVEGFVSQLNPLTLERSVDSVKFTADNQTELHFGAEYFFNIRSAILFVRAGFYTDPDNSIRLERAKGGDTANALTAGNIFPARDDETHVTGGLGLAYGDFEFGVAYDSSDIETQSLFSFIYRLRR